MPTTGHGLGTSPFGVGTPPSAAEPPDLPAAMSRYINPATKQFEIDDVTGNFKSMPTTRQRVLLIMMTIKGSSSALRNFGIAIPSKVNRDTIEQEMRTEIDRAFYRMTTVERVIRIDDVIVDPGDYGRVALTLVYTDLTTRQADQRVTV